MKRLIIIAGPTGIGKTDLSIELAKEYNTEIISADSRQIYKEMQIGTAVPDQIQLNLVKHHFIQSISIHEYYSASLFEEQVLEKLAHLFNESSTIIMAGGSGMYIDAVCNGMDNIPTVENDIRLEIENIFKENGIEYVQKLLKKLDPEYYNSIDLKNYKRILKALEVCFQTGTTYTSFRTGIKKTRDFQILKIGLQLPREIIYNRIEQRVDLMLQKGLVEEAESLYEFKKLNSLNTVGYKELFNYFDKTITLNEAIDQIKQNTRHFAKRQLTWFNKDKNYHWYMPNQLNEIISLINSIH